MADRKGWLAAIGVLALAAGGVGQAWAAAAVTVTIEPAAESGEFIAVASVRDLATDAIIAAPRLAVRAGAQAEASLEDASGGEPAVRFEVGVDATATRATWRLEWRRGGRLEALSEGSITLGRPDEGVY